LLRNCGENEQTDVGIEWILGKDENKVKKTKERVQSSFRLEENNWKIAKASQELEPDRSLNKPEN